MEILLVMLVKYMFVCIYSRIMVDQTLYRGSEVHASSGRGCSITHVT